MTGDVGDSLRHLLLVFNEQVKPFHEWLDGQRAHFTSQGYTDDEARAMAAAEFVTVFGANITRTLATTETPDDTTPSA